MYAALIVCLALSTAPDAETQEPSTPALEGSPESGDVESGQSIEFDGDTYVEQFEIATPEIRLMEFVRPNETVENWTKLLAVRNFTQLDDPGQSAAAVGKTLQQMQPEAKYRLLEKEDGSEAIIDFITWPADASYLEFNIHRYLKKPGLPGLVSYQFAYKFTDTSPESQRKFQELRAKWVDEMSEADWNVEFERAIGGNPLATADGRAACGGANGRRHSPPGGEPL